MTDAILFAAQAAFHPRLVPSIFIDNSKSLLQRSRSAVSFPSTGNTLSTLDLMKISDITILYANYRLIYYISVPLTDHHKFVLYKVSPLRTRQNNLNLSNTFAYIWPESHYLAVNIIEDTYIPTTLEKINKCKNLDDLLICKETESIREISQHASCEIKFIAKKNVIDLSECDLKIIRLRDTFWQ